jgi:hypothetical protein
MTLNCPDCGQKAALVRVSILVDPHDTSIESLSPQVAQVLGMEPSDFPDEADVVCTACEAESPYKWALAATHRADAHQKAKNDLAEIIKMLVEFPELSVMYSKKLADLLGEEE